MRIRASMRAPMMWPQQEMKYWHRLRTTYIATSPAATHGSTPMMASRALTKKSRTKKLRIWGNAKSMAASNVAHTKSATNRNVNGL